MTFNSHTIGDGLLLKGDGGQDYEGALAEDAGDDDYYVTDNGASGLAPGESGATATPPPGGGRSTAGWQPSPQARPAPRTGLPRASGALGPTSRDAMAAACGSVPGR
jgi:hypothetical protein